MLEKPSSKKVMLSFSEMYQRQRQEDRTTTNIHAENKGEAIVAAAV